MPKDLFLRAGVDLDFIYPPFLTRTLEAIASARARGRDYYALFGFRRWALQHQMRAAYLAGNGGKAAPAGYSAHNYGLAFDFAYDLDATKPGLQPGWLSGHYEVLGEESYKVGLVWGASFNDRPHIQWPGFVSAKELEPLNKIWKSSQKLTDLARLKEVWSYLDSLPHPL